MAINRSRVLLGGLAAGVVMNVIGGALNAFLLGPQLNAQMDTVAPGLSAKMATGATISVNVGTQFVIGILLVWLYAAMRPRFRQGPRTAVRSALVPWLCGLFFYSGWLLTGMMSSGMYAILSLVALINVIAGAMVGAWLYREDEAPPRT
jgi:hypothetical protein